MFLSTSFRHQFFSLSEVRKEDGQILRKKMVPEEYNERAENSKYMQ